MGGPTMNTASVLKSFQNVQRLFQIASALQLTTYLWPQPIPVRNGTGYDYIIVGGGTAGCVIASRLVELRNVSVLVIEAGGNPPLESIYTRYFAYMRRTIHDWNVTASHESWMENQQSGKATIVQGKMLGGSSSLGDMIYDHGNPADYDSWASLVNDQSWSYKKIHNYFLKTEKVNDAKLMRSKQHKDMHGTNGKLRLRKFYFDASEKYLRALKEMGNKIVRNINARNPLGFTHALYTCGKRVRQSTAYAFLRPEKYNPHLNLLTHTVVDKIIFDEFNNAIGVQILTGNKNKMHIEARREVILTAGVFKTPQILMLSGIGPKAVLNSKSIKVISNLPVGKNLQDHPVCVSVYKVGLKSIPYDVPNPYKISYPQLNGYVSLNDYETIPTYGIRSFILDDPKIFLELCAMSLNFKNSLCDHLFQGSANHEIFLVLNHLAYPKSRGEVRLATKKITNNPNVKLGLYSNSNDIEMHAKAVMHFNQITNTTFFNNNNAELVDPHIKCGKIDFTAIKYWKCYCKHMVTTLYNNVGTCAMGSVVDANLFVKGVHRLRVADASVMPTIVSSPTLASVIMIAEKAADLIKDDLIRHSK